MAHTDLLQELKEGIQTGRIPLITNPHVEDTYKKAYAEPFVKALEAGLEARTRTPEHSLRITEVAYEPL